MLLLSMSIFCDEKHNSISENIQIPLISQGQNHNNCHLFRFVKYKKRRDEKRKLQQAQPPQTMKMTYFPIYKTM